MPALRSTTARASVLVTAQEWEGGSEARGGVTSTPKVRIVAEVKTEASRSRAGDEARLMKTTLAKTAGEVRILHGA